MKILKKEILAQTAETRLTKLIVEARHIASKALAGQFVVLMVSEEGERIPLTVVDTDTANGTITLIFQEVGLTTKLLGRLEPGDSLYSLSGPLGHPTEIKDYGNAILIGGGVGIAEIYPVAKALRKRKNRITTILGTRTKPLLILESELKEVSEEVFIATDDGSYGQKGFVTDVLKEILSTNQKRPVVNLVYAVGPIPMMKMVSAITKDFGIKTLVSLNALMVDGTGMCGCCRVTIAGRLNFSCVDGPDFDGHSVDWEELAKRNNIYRDKENHICNLYKM